MNQRHFLLLVICCLLLCNCREVETYSPPKSFHELQNELTTAETVQRKCEHLWELANWQNERAYNVDAADSLYFEAVLLASNQGDSELELKSCIEFLSNIQSGAEDENDKTEKYKESINRAVRILERAEKEGEHHLDWLVITWANYLLGIGGEQDNAEQVLKNMQTINLNAIDCESDICKVRTSMLRGDMLRYEPGELTGAHKFYGQAGVKIEELDNKSVKTQLDLALYSRYAEMYLTDLGDPEMALDKLIKQKQVLEEHYPFDSISLMWNQFNIAECRMEIDEEKGVEMVSSKKALDKVLDFTKRNQYRKLEVYAHSMYRTLLLKKTEPSGYSDLYVKRYPEVLEFLLPNDPNLYYIIRARMSEETNQLDSADLFYQRAKSTLSEDTSYEHMNLHEMYGGFLLRMGQPLKALNQFHQAYDYSSTLLWPEKNLSLSKTISSIYDDLGDTTRAYPFLKIAYELDKEIGKDKDLNEFLLRDLKQQEERMYIEIKQNKEKKKRKDGRQIITIFLMVIALFVVLIVVSSMVVSQAMIEMLGFFSILAIFELVILLVNKQIEPITSTSIFAKYGITVLILSVIFPLHHLIEHRVTDYLKRKKLIRKPKKISIRRTLAVLWPWLASENRKKEEENN